MASELVVARIVAADDLVGGRGPSYRLTLDLGSRGTRRASIYVGARYDDRQGLVGRQVIVILEGDETSVLCAHSHAMGDVLIRPEEAVEDGTVVA